MCSSGAPSPTNHYHLLRQWKTTMTTDIAITRPDSGYATMTESQPPGSGEPACSQEVIPTFSWADELAWLLGRTPALPATPPPVPPPTLLDGSPCRPPDWRWLRVQALSDGGRRFSRRLGDDDWVRQGRTFLKSWRGCRDDDD